jgi:hypothetical protein
LIKITYKIACSGKSSNSPFNNILKPLIVSSKLTYSPGEPVKISATKNGCDKKRSTLRARATVKRSSSDNSSIPRIAIIGCNVSVPE